MVTVTEGHERARLFPEGGIGFDRYTGKGIGWVVCDEPSDFIARLALAVRPAAFPTLYPHGSKERDESVAEELRAALSACVRAIDAIHPHDDCVRELGRAGLSEDLARAARRAVGILDSTAV